MHFRVLVLLCLLAGCRSQNLRIRAGNPTAGAVATECTLGGQEIPGRVFLMVEVTTPCTAKSPVHFAIINAARTVADGSIDARLEPGHKNYLRTPAFPDPQKGAEIRIEVWAECGDDKLHGSDYCQMP